MAQPLNHYFKEENTVTENATWSEEYGAHDLWSIEKSLTPMSPEEEREAWRKTIGILKGLCTMADALVLDPLILALTDALTRSREELERLEDKLSRPPLAEGESWRRDKVRPREDERLIRMLRRSDAFTTALWLIEKYAKEECRPGSIDHEIEAIWEANERAGEELHTCRKEALASTSTTYYATLGRGVTASAPASS